MTSQFKFQGSIKAMMVAVVVAVLSLPSMDVSAQRAVKSGGRGQAADSRPTNPPPGRAVVVKPTCKVGGPGITPC
jgi:hypothetical protein